MEDLNLIYNSVIKASLDVIISINDKEEIILWNDASTRAFGYTEKEALGKRITKIIPEKYHKKHKSGFKRFLKTGKPKLIGKIAEVEGRKKDGRLFPIELALSVSKSKKGQIFTAIIRDISERKSFEKKLEEMAIKDSLTGMYNRHYFEEVIDKEFERARRYKHSISMLMLDMDKFKFINDEYGHAQGDIVLKGVSRCLAKSVRVTDIVIRYGGDEFLIVLPETDSKHLKKIIKNVKSEVKKWGEQFEFPVGISIGGCTLGPGKKKDVDEMLKKADKRLYKDKKHKTK